jgi:tRNA threonylcarbamoyladenosine biosynthesis protein TsaE
VSFHDGFNLVQSHYMESEMKVVDISGLPALAAELLLIAKGTTSAGATIIALHGDLGAGKTTFVQTLGRTLGVTEQITSPTFTIMKGYETADADFEHLIHMDAYRLEDISELAPLRFSEILATPKTLFCIEWAERIKDALPVGVINITLAVADETTRTVHIARD